MEQYEIIKTILRLLPITLIFIVFIFVKNKNWYFRYPIVILLGWVIVFLSVQFFWSYSFNYAPTEEIKHQVGMKDGAPAVGSLFFGWIYALVLMIAYDIIYKIYLYLLQRFFRTPNKNEKTQ